MTIYKYDGSAAALTADAAVNLFGTTAQDTLSGTALNESLWGGEGDRMAGGAGDDSYWIKSAGDVVVEKAGEGIDLIGAWSSVWLGDHPHVENLKIGGDNNYAAGNALDNVIEGQAGNQQLYGGLGQDVLIGGAGADVFIVVKGEGNDVIQDFNTSEDVVRLKAGFTSFAQVKGALSQVGADVRLDLGGGDALMFRNIQVNAFSADDFQLQIDTSTLGRLTFADEFSGRLSLWDKESNPTGTWRPDYGYQGSQGTGSYTLMSNDEKQIYTSPYFRDHAGDFSESPFVSNSDGTLSIWLKPSSNPEIFGYNYTSGLISTQATFAQTYGYFEIRADLPEAAGAWPAFWLIPADGSWPPELDVMEALTHDPHAAWTTWHSSNGGHTGKGVASFVPDTADGFHTYGALWTPTELVWHIDGVEVFRQPTPSDMHKPMFMIANLAAGGWGGAIDAGALPAEFKIDYIRAYALPGDTTAPPAPVTSTPAAPAPAPAPAPVPAGATQPSPNGAALEGTAGADNLIGGVGNDSINGGDGSDFIRGGEGDDRASGGDAFDDIHGNQGNDTLAGGAGHDWVVGGKDADRLFGDEGDDIVYGNMGNDLVDGGAGNDLLRGGQDDDILFGWSGDDWMSGDRGSDTMSGGSGADIFNTFAEAGVDLVIDFSVLEGDRVRVEGGATWTVKQVGDDVVIDLSGGAQLTLDNVRIADLGDGWIFAG